MAISVEDIGFGCVEAPNLIYTLNCIRKEYLYNDGDRPMFFVHAIRFLCRQKKERSSDNVKNMLIKDFKHGRGVEVPDYAYDLHTKKGREMGRDELHFLTEASRVIPQLEGEDIKKIYNDYCWNKWLYSTNFSRIWNKGFYIKNYAFSIWKCISI